MAITRQQEQKNNHKMVLASLTMAAVLAASRPALLSKVYATSNLNDWTRQDDIDLMGGATPLQQFLAMAVA